MATQAQVDAFNSAVASGNFGAAADIAAGAGYGAADVESYIEANAGNLGFAPGTDIPSDVVAGYFGGGSSVSAPTTGVATTGDGAAAGGSYVDQQAVNLLNQFNSAMTAKDYSGASNLINQAAQIYGPDTYANMAAYLGLPAGAGASSFSPSTLQSLGSTFVPKPPIPPVRPVTPLQTTGSSNIDPLIAPYLQEALEKSRSLFLGGPGPQLYPGQMYVEPSAQTEAALSQVEQLAGAATPFYEQAQRGVTTGLTGLEQTAGGAFLGGSPYRDAMIEAATRPLTQQFTEQVMPGIQSTFSRAGRLGSGAQAAVTGRATEGFTRALGDVTASIAAQDYARERAFQESAARDVISQAGNLGNVFSSFLAPSQALAQVGAQREAIAGQPLQEAMQRFQYSQEQPFNMLSGYLSSIYGSPLGRLTQPQEAQRNTLGQALGGGILGSQLGGLFGGAGGFTGGQIGAGLGVLGGLLL